MNYLQLIKDYKFARLHVSERRKEITGNTSYKHRCNKGHVFFMAPKKVLIGVSTKEPVCPECRELSGKSVTASATYSLKLVNAMLKESGIIAFGYTNAYTTEKFKCREGHVFKAKAGTVVQSRQCPKCMTPIMKGKLENLRPLYVRLGLEVVAARRNPDLKSGVLVQTRCIECKHTEESVLKTRPLRCSCRKATKELLKQASAKRAPKIKGCMSSKDQFQQALQIKFDGSIRLIGAFGDDVKLKHTTCGGTWITTPANVLCSVYGCPTCGRKNANVSNRVTQEKVEQRVLVRTLGKIAFIDKYEGYGKLYAFRCQCGNEFKLRENLVDHTSCKTCFPKQGSSSYSMKSRRWLADIEKTLFIKVRLEERIQIGRTYVSLDGYCKETNTAFEFLGSVWHGDPYRFKRGSTPHPHSDSTAEELQLKDWRRFVALTKKGINVMWVYESQYHKGELVSGKLSGVKSS